MSFSRWRQRLLLPCVLGFATLFLCGCDGHWEDFEQITGYKGKARLNPFLAAQRMLDALGHETREVKILGKLPDHSAVLVVSGEGGMTEGRARQMLSWAYSGGHLIYCLDGTGPYNDFDSEFGSFLAAMLLEEQKDPVLERLGIGVEKRFDSKELAAMLHVMIDGELGTPKEKADKGAEKKEPAAKAEEEKEEDEEDKKDESRLEALLQLDWRGSSYSLMLGGHRQLSLQRDLRAGEFSAGPQDKALALHVQHGMGQVTLITHALPFRNRWLAENDHARWLADLVGDGMTKEVVFVAASTESFFGLVWKHGWMAVVAGVACLVFWLWRQMPRFGPLAEVELDSTRHFASHIGALGEFFWRLKQGPLLVNAARDAVWARVHEKHRSLDDGSRLVSDELAQFLAARSGLPVKRVLAAFEMPAPASTHPFVSLMRDLQTLRRSL